MELINPEIMQALVRALDPFLCESLGFTEVPILKTENLILERIRKLLFVFLLY